MADKESLKAQGLWDYLNDCPMRKSEHGHRETSNRVGTIAGILEHIDVDTLRARANGDSTAQILVDEIQALAGSCLSQVETPEQQPATFLDRLDAEHKQLSNRISKLTHFLGMGATGASDAQRDLLEVQLMTMSVYKRVLELRLGDLNSEENRGTFSTMNGEQR